MPKAPKPRESGKGIPEGHHQLEGSERRPSPTAKYLGPADLNEQVSVTIVLRRRSDGPPVPSLTDFASMPPSQRRRMSEEEFAAKYGAAEADIDRVTAFAKSQALMVTETNAARRSVVVSGTVAQMNKAFAVSLGLYRHETIVGRRRKPQTVTYPGRGGFIHVPDDLTDVVVGVFAACVGDFPG